MYSRDELIEHLANESKVLNNPFVRRAFESVDRADFVAPDYKTEAYEDYPLPIGFGATLSQPTTAAFMLELLDATEGDKVLDVGSGSGWTTALLSKIVGKGGEVTGVEIIPELVALGNKVLPRPCLPRNTRRRQGRGTGENFVAEESAPPTHIYICGFNPASPSDGVFSAIAIKIWKNTRTKTEKLRKR